MSSGVYTIKNKVNNKIYVGISRELEKKAKKSFLCTEV
ncbi:GIY-YIG nuclease family protein [Clostridium sp.]|nr:GIY-YIG nuclease family protein [Clostridium sp.]MCI9069404.1 GIY-YIG nuclease family protein [Clostridium sp.]